MNPARRCLRHASGSHVAWQGVALTPKDDHGCRVSSPDPWSFHGNAWSEFAFVPAERSSAAMASDGTDIVSASSVAVGCGHHPRWSWAAYAQVARVAGGQIASQRRASYGKLQPYGWSALLLITRSVGRP